MKTESSSNKTDIYTRVTDQIIRAIEEGVDDFKMPWHQAIGLPQNASTGNCYRGINTVALWAAGQMRGYKLPYWATFLQWQKLGAVVRRNEKATAVVFYKRLESSLDEESDYLDTKARAVLKSSFVFNAEQIDGWSCPVPSLEDKTDNVQTLDTFIESLGADIRYGRDNAAFDTRRDLIHMPDRCRFVGTATSTATESFYATMLHEHVHWSGHPKRLNRDLSSRFGTQGYAVEELVAELGAAFLCAELGLTPSPRLDHAAYVQNWLRVLRDDNKAIFTAASTAKAACQFLAELAAAKTTVL